MSLIAAKAIACINLEWGTVGINIGIPGMGAKVAIAGGKVYRYVLTYVGGNVYPNGSPGFIAPCAAVGKTRGRVVTAGSNLVKGTRYGVTVLVANANFKAGLFCRTMVAGAFHNYGILIYNKVALGGNVKSIY